MLLSIRSMLLPCWGPAHSQCGLLWSCQPEISCAMNTGVCALSVNVLCWQSQARQQLTVGQLLCRTLSINVPCLQVVMRGYEGLKILPLNHGHVVHMLTSRPG